MRVLTTAQDCFSSAVINALAGKQERLTHLRLVLA